MSEPKQKRQRRKINIDDLEVNKETLQNLTQSEADQVKGGAMRTPSKYVTCLDATCVSCNAVAVC
jgi:hypothetical protein